MCAVAGRGGLPEHIRALTSQQVLDVEADLAARFIGRAAALTERYAELGQVGIVANWRGDVQVAWAKAFSVYKCLQGA